MRVNDAGYSTYTPPAHSDPPPTDTTQHGNSPQTVVAPVRYNPPPTTPAQRVDLAVAKYKAAVASGDENAIKQTRQDLYAAVRDEIGPQIDTANRGVPPDFRTLTDQQISSYGNVILRRNSSDPTTQGVLKDAIHDYQIQRKADDLIPQFSGNFTPQEKLDSLKLSLQGQSPEVVARIMQNPAVQKMLQDAVKWIAEPCNGLSGNENRDPTLEASQRLADVTADLSPEYAALIVKQSMPTIQKIAGLDANYSGSTGFTNLSKVVDSLGDTPEAQALTNQIAQDYREQFNTWEGRFDDTHIGFIKATINAGASPKLALALAAQLKADGKTAEAGVVLRSIERGVEDLQRNIQQDVKEYTDLTSDLSWLIASSKDKLTPEQLKKAIDDYIARQGPDWQSKLHDIEERMTAHVRSLKEDIGQLKGLPEDLKQTAPDVFEDLKNNVGHDPGIQNAIQFATSRDPSIFKGDTGANFMTFLIEDVHAGKDFVQSLAKAYVAGNVLPAMEELNALHPDSVARANKALEYLRSHPVILGLPPQAVEADINKLKELIAIANTTTDTGVAMSNYNKLTEMQHKLGELKDLTLNAGPAGLAFRFIALAISGKAAFDSASASLDNPDLQNVLGTLANSVGLVQDSVRFAALMKKVDSSGELMQWAVGGGEKLFGFLTEAYFFAGALKDTLAGDAPAVAFDVAGAGGAALAAFGEGLGAWSGPAGWAIVTIAILGVEAARHGHEIRHHTEIAHDFLKGAGLGENAARSLSDDALEEATTVQDQLKLNPKQLQDLAASHPEIFTGGPGAAQAVIDAVTGSGIQGQDVLPFIDRIAKDDQDYVQTFNANRSQSDSAHQLTYASTLFNLVQSMPDAKAFVEEHSPGLVGPDAKARREADIAYEGSDRSQEQVAGLLSTNQNAAYRAEIINLLQQNHTLDTFVRAMRTNLHYNGWPEAARAAIQSAANAGVLTPAQAHDYLVQIG